MDLICCPEISVDGEFQGDTVEVVSVCVPKVPIHRRVGEAQDAIATFYGCLILDIDLLLELPQLLLCEVRELRLDLRLGRRGHTVCHTSTNPGIYGRAVSRISDITDCHRRLA